MLGWLPIARHLGAAVLEVSLQTPWVLARESCASVQLVGDVSRVRVAHVARFFTPPDPDRGINFEPTDLLLLVVLLAEPQESL